MIRKRECKVSDVYYKKEPDGGFTLMVWIENLDLPPPKYKAEDMVTVKPNGKVILPPKVKTTVDEFGRTWYHYKLKHK